MSIYKNVFNESNIPWSYNIDDLTTYYREYKNNEFLEYKNAWFYLFNSSYDLLVKNQETQSKKIFNFCNLNWEKDTLKYYKNIIPIQTVSIEQARNLYIKHH